MNENDYLPKYIVPSRSRASKLMKRNLDIIGSLIGIFITLPIYIVFYFVYLFGENKGPMFFKQSRIGKDGKLFKIYKFRSMVMNAEEKLKGDQELFEKYILNNYKLEPDEDPRITKFGLLIRKTSLDELPQFINVLKGDMSLIGPRPIVREELVEYGLKKDDFLSVKPGLTGYWQTSGRSNVGYPERVDIELYYVYNQSLKLEFQILLKTIIQVLQRKGAY